MEFLSSLFVGKPLNILLVAALFLTGYIARRWMATDASRPSRSLLFAAIGWALYAAWEWAVRAYSPEANIRVDLLVIWPLLAIFSAWAIFRAIR